MIIENRNIYSNIRNRGYLLKPALSFLILLLLFIILSGAAPAPKVNNSKNNIQKINPSKSNVPQIFFKETSYTTGEVLEGTPIEHTFTVYNRGNAVLKIDKAKPS